MCNSVCSDVDGMVGWGGVCGFQSIKVLNGLEIYSHLGEHEVFSSLFLAFRQTGKFDREGSLLIPHPPNKYTSRHKYTPVW